MNKIESYAVVDDFTIQRVLNAGGSAARGYGVPHCDWEICAVEFSENMLDPLRWQLWETKQFPERWLKACAANFARNYCKHDAFIHAKEQGMDAADLDARGDESASDALDQHVCSLEVKQALVAAMGALPQRQRKFISLRFIERWSVSEITAAESVSAEAAGMTIKRGLRQLRLILEDAGFD